MDKVQCICCDKLLDTEFFQDDLFVLSPVYDGLIFRASGNYGSTVFDPMPIGQEEYLQVIICDDCIRRKAKRVTRIHDIKRSVTSEAEEFIP